MPSNFAITAAILFTSTHDVHSFSTPITLQNSNCNNIDLISHRSSTAIYATTHNKKKGSGNKKRRFLQQAHPLPPQSTTNTQETSDNLSNLNGSRNTISKNKAKEGSSSKQRRRGPPLQTSKSIEELEAILEKRWGTAGSTSSQSKKDIGDADFVMSFGEDDEYDSTTNTGASNLKGAAVFRANRVMDPWAEEDGLFDNNKPNKSNEERQPSTKKVKQKFDKQEAMLNRVRSNQDRLQSKRPQQRKKDVVVPIASKDYYDEDDEGYESNKRNGNLISPRPVGGSGGGSSGRNSKREQKRDTSSLSGGIFSDRSSDNREQRSTDRREQRREARRLEREERKKKPKRKEPRLKPLLDEDGNEMYLTLDQADKIVQNILSSTSGEDTNDGEDGSMEVSQWEDIGITNPTLLSNLQSSTMTCPYPLPVQDKACPAIVAMNDVLISTHTGSGKTLAFLAPIAQSLMLFASNKNKGVPGASGSFPKAVIVAPGRELASQIVSVAQALFADTGLTVSMAIGGTPYSRNVENLRKKKPDVVVGTPGRIAELIIGRPGEKSGKMKISGLQSVVLDEFDALLQYDSHKEPTMAIMNAIDRQHGTSLQRILCSATATDMLGQETSDKKNNGPNIEDYLRPGYAHASVDDNDLLVTSGVEQSNKSSTSARVSRTTIHGALHVPHQRLALEAVRKILNTEPTPQQALIFVDSPRRVDIVIEKLARMDIIAAPLHGGAGSGKGDRAQVNKALREGYVGLVVATEMAARGIDAPYLTHVINLDLPTDASHYAHRAGRCGRGGRPGVAVSITCDPREKNVPKRFADELGITMYNVEAREGKLRIVEG